MRFENWTIEDLIARCADFDEMTLEMDREEFAALRRKITELKQAGNSPVIPDGYVMVPKVATEKMLIAGLEEADPLGSLIDWDASRGDCNTREQVQGMFEAMLAAASQEDINALIPLVSRNEQEVK
ncbi:TPA: hypothetical protein ACWW29_003938 [Klebsiella quasipneumoniae subsp. similipneumoniae]